MKMLPKLVPEHVLENLLLFLCPLVNPTSIFMFSQDLSSLFPTFRLAKTQLWIWQQFPNERNHPDFSPNAAERVRIFWKNMERNFTWKELWKNACQLKNSQVVSHACDDSAGLRSWSTQSISVSGTDTWTLMSDVLSTTARGQGACEEITIHSH